jgi:hypothetical protein
MVLGTREYKVRSGDRPFLIIIFASISAKDQTLVQADEDGELVLYIALLLIVRIVYSW